MSPWHNVIMVQWQYTPYLMRLDPRTSCNKTMVLTKRSTFGYEHVVVDIKVYNYNHIPYCMHTVNRLRSFLSSSHLVIWSSGHLVSWSSGQVVNRSCGHLVIRSSSHPVVILSSNHPVIPSTSHSVILYLRLIQS